VTVGLVCRLKVIRKLVQQNETCEGSLLWSRMCNYEETIRLAEKIAAQSVSPANVTGHTEGCHYDPQTKSVRLITIGL
jgi:hypothetical protein